MITIKIGGLESDTDSNRLWQGYANAGYSNSGYIGFRAYVAALVPEAQVSGTTQDGLTLRFKDEVAYTMFNLKWL